MLYTDEQLETIPPWFILGCELALPHICEEEKTGYTCPLKQAKDYGCIDKRVRCDTACFCGLWLMYGSAECPCHAQSPEWTEERMRELICAWHGWIRLYN